MTTITRFLVRAAVCVLPLLAAGQGRVQAQSSAFYTNTDRISTQNVEMYVGNAELIDDISFAGTYRVDGFTIGYDIPNFTPAQYRNMNVRFYEPDPATGFASDTLPMTQFELSNLKTGLFNTVDIDLAAMGQSFLWTAGDTFGGEQGGLLGLQFDPNSDGRWYLADGGGSSNTYVLRSYNSYSGFPSTGGYSDQLLTVFFGQGHPFEGSFYAVVYGEAVPEPSACALFAGLSGAGAGLLLRRRRVRKAGVCPS